MIGSLLAGVSTAQAQANKQADDARLGANGLFALGLYVQAIGAYTTFLKKWPNDPNAVKVQYGLGASHFHLKQYDKAEAVMSKVVGNPKCPDKPRSNFILGQSLLMLRKPANAEGTFDTGIKALPAPKTPQDVALLANLKEMRLEALFQQQKWKDVVAATAALKGKGGQPLHTRVLPGSVRIVPVAAIPGIGRCVHRLETQCQGYQAAAADAFSAG